MAECKECLHFDVCEALENGNGIKKVHPIQCGCFKDKADVVKVVRCKDCKFRRPRNKSEKNIYFEDVLICESCQMADEPCAVCDTDFCSYGELKEAEG